MVTLEENRWGLKGSNSAFSRRGGGNAIISERPRKRTRAPNSPNAASSTLLASHQPGPGMPAPCTYHLSDISHLIVLISSRAIRQIALFAATWVTSLYNSGGLQRALQKMQQSLGKTPAFHRQQRFNISARIWGDSGGCRSHCLPGKEAVAWPVCWETHAGFVCAGAPSPSSPQMVRSHDCTVKIELV